MWQWFHGGFSSPRQIPEEKGIESAFYSPSSRSNSITWIDNEGNLWLYGGAGSSKSNDLWKFNIETMDWAWIGGEMGDSEPPVFGEQGIPAPENHPGSRYSSASWTDSNGDLWLYGGSRYNQSSNGYAYGNDMWKYNISTGLWTWVKGSQEINAPEYSAGLGVEDPANVPGAGAAFSWRADNQNIMLYKRSEIWRFNGQNWIKIKNSKSKTLGELGVYDPENSPGTNSFSSGRWADADGSLVMYGKSTLWRYDINLNSWARLHGHENDRYANYGQMGQGFLSNRPGERTNFGYWADSERNFYIYGGSGYDESENGKLSDVWKTNRNYYVISGNVKYDENNDGCLNSTVNIPGVKLNISDAPQGRFTFSNSQGNYLEISTTPEFDITAELPHYTFTPTSAHASYDIFGQVLNFDFCAIGDGDFNDLEIIILPLTQAAPGFEAQYKILIKNTGNQSMSGDVLFTYAEELMSLTDTSETPVSHLDGNIKWDFFDLGPFTNREYIVSFELNTPMDDNPLNAGDVLHFYAEVNPQDGDMTPENNVFDLYQTVINSFDPNDKTLLEGPEVTEDYIGEYVNYMIRFENLGTGKATHVVVKDIIDPAKFDIESIWAVDQSHDYRFSMDEDGEISFSFENINLHYVPGLGNTGYVVFKIKLKENLQPGDVFSNSANIYFDYNFPIETNEYDTLIKDEMKVLEFEKNELVYYPNPVVDILNFETEDRLRKLSVFDTAGRLIQVLNLKENKVNLNSLSSGIYFLTVKSDKKEYKLKIIKK